MKNFANGLYDRRSYKPGGYYTEEFTHLAVAAAVAGGVADASIGIEAAARKLKMHFMPLFSENCYLLAKRETAERSDARAIVSVLKSEDFPKLVRRIPGYDASRAGEVISVADVVE